MRIRAMEDEKIIDLYWNRDQGAIRHTAEKYGSYCGRIAKNILLNKEDCEECVNDTWLRAWNAMPDERPAILSAFLGAITRNLSLDRYRKLHTAKIRFQLLHIRSIPKSSHCKYRFLRKFPSFRLRNRLIRQQKRRHRDTDK